MKVQSYLYFDGRCEEALDFYRKALGAEVTTLMRWKDMPAEAGSPDCGGPSNGANEGTVEGAGPGNGPVDGNKVMHSEFKIGDTTLMASDGMPPHKGHAVFQGISLALSPSTEAEAKRLFTVLSDGGQVQMPMDKTFFASAFGMVADRFGVSWIVIAEP